MAALITVEDLLARPGFDGVDEASAEAVLEDVSALVLQIAGVDPPWTVGTVPAAVVPVVVSMARRGLLNPLGRTGETLGDHTWQAAGQGTAGLYATRYEERIIRRAAGRLGAATVNLEAGLPLPVWRGGGFGFEDKLLDAL